MRADDKAWQLLSDCEPGDVCRRAVARYSEESGSYALPVLGDTITVTPSDRTLAGSSPESELVLTKAAYFSRLSILHYLVGAQEIEPSGRLVKPADLASGHIYLQGSHVLPLEPIAARFSTDTEGFVGQGARFGGERRAYGDAGVELRPFPRMPITMVLWQEDDEFPARSDLLFDSTCERHVPEDILWSVAMLCAIVMLQR